MKYYMMVIAKDGRKFYVGNNNLLTKNEQHIVYFTHWTKCKKVAALYKYYKVISIDENGVVKYF